MSDWEYGDFASVITPAGWTEERCEATAAALAEERPCLLSCVLPAEGLTPDLVLVAADFSKCFAAALLLEKR